MFLDRLPIAAWKLDDTGSTAIDSIGSLDGTHDAGVTPNVSSKIQKGASYDGSSTGFTSMGLAAGTGPERSSPFSVSFWMKFDTITNTRGVLVSRSAGPGTRRGWYIGMLAGGGIYCDLASDHSSLNYLGKSSAGAGIEDGNIHHIVVSYDGTGIASGLRFYIDGVLISSAIERNTLTDTIIDNGAEFVLGSYGPNGNRGAPTSLDFLDDVSFFNVALTWREAYLIYKNGLLGTSIADFTTPTIDSNSGHELDENTAALWRLDEVASYGHPHLKTSKAEINSSMDLIQTTNGRAPQICGGPNGGINARWFDGNNSMSILGVVNTDIRTALTSGNCTVECWIYWSADNVLDTIFSVDGSGETESTNVLLAIRLDSSRLELFWEHGAGSNVTHTSGTLLPFTQNDGWHHIAVIIQDAGSGTCNVDMYIDGSLHDSVSGLTRATGGADATISVGAWQSHTDRWKGGISDIRISNIARDGSVPTNFQHTNDANTVELWRFNEAPESKCLTQVLDVAPHLNPKRTADDPPTPDPIDGLIGGSGYARYSDGSPGTQYLEFSGTEELRQVLLGEWTWESWVKLGDNVTSGNRVIMTYAGSGETLDTNFLFRVGYNRSNNQFESFWESGAGVDVIEIFQTTNLLDPKGGQSRRHIAISKTDEGGGTSYQLDLYIDGKHIETITSVSPAEGGADGNLFLAGEVGGANAWSGQIDDIRLSNVVRTPAEIQTSYERGTLATGAPTRYYLMAAIDNNADGSPGQEQPFYRTWKVQDEPDPTAALYEGSFFGASINFTNIYIQATWLE